MAFIGIVAQKKEENDIEKNLKSYFEIYGQKHTIFPIQSDNIENMRNIKFETILICTDTICKEKQECLRQMIQSAAYVIVNADSVKTTILKETKAMIITYGFQAKATITMSSINDEDMILCIQREFVNINHINVEPQEISISLNKLLGNKYSKMGSFVLQLLYESQKNKKSY